MYILTRTISIVAISTILILGGSPRKSYAHFSGGEITVIMGLCGGAIGGFFGAAAGAMSDSDQDETDEMTYIGMGVGAGAAITYVGVKMLRVNLMTHSPSSYSSMFMDNGMPKGLIHFDAYSSVPEIQPANILPRPEFLQEAHSLTYRFDVLTVSF